MRASDFFKLLDAALHKAQKRISLTMTDVPAGEIHLRQMLEGAFAAGLRYDLPLREVQLSFERFPSLARRFSLARVTESGHPDVLRLIYDPDFDI